MSEQQQAKRQPGREYYAAFGRLAPVPFGVPAEEIEAAWIAALERGEPIPDDYDWYPDLPDGALV
jgi:hypothetical protein